MSVPVFVSGASRQSAPVSSLTVSAASWRGTSMTQKAFTTLTNASFQGRGNGRFSLNDGKGLRIGASKGTIDTEFRMGSGASTVVLVQSSYSSTTAPLITIGVNSSGQAVGSIQDIAGTTAAAWAATTMGTIPRTVNVRMQVAWDCSAPIDGAHHVWVVVNGRPMPHFDFTTAPVTSWAPFQPLYVTTGLYCETGFDGEMLFTQASATAPVLAPATLRAVDVQGSTLQLPLPALTLSGTISPRPTVVGSLTLPSLQLSGAFTVTVPAPIKRWYRLAASTPNAGEYDTITEVFGGAAVVQTDADRKPAAATSNGLPVATFDGTDVMLITLDPAGSGNNGTSQWWTAFRFKPAGFNSSQTFLGWTSAAGTAPNKLAVGFPNDGTGKITFTVFASGFNGRVYTTTGGVVDATWNHVYVQFDGTRTNEFDSDGLTSDAKVRVFVGNTALAITAGDSGTGGTASALLSSVGTAALGGGNDVDAPSGPLRNGAQMGPNLLFGTTPLSAAQLAAIVNFEVPT